MALKEQAQYIIKKQHDLSKKYLDAELNDSDRKSIGTQLSSIEYTVPLAEHYLMMVEELEHNIKDQKDSELFALAKEEQKSIELKLSQAEDALNKALLPVDPYEKYDVIVEIRSGTGGLEAGLFVADILRMYELYAKAQGWKVSIIDVEETGIEGITQAIISITYKSGGVYGNMQFESGIHRVQRVPKTENSGRIHTSAITVAVFPQIDQDVNVQIHSDDLRIDTYRASGAGGQHVNKTDSAVRITHIPSGIVVKSQNQRSQHQNKDTAMKLLKVRLLDLEMQSQKNAMDKDRKMKVGSGDRSGRIRTYNFPQKRVTDHRIDMTIYQLDSFLNGDMDTMIHALQKWKIEEQLRYAHL